MEEWFNTVLPTLLSHPVMQGMLIIIGTCFLEDPARCAVVVLLAGGYIGLSPSPTANWWLVLLMMTIGGMVGDIGLYLIGRFSMSLMVRFHFADPERIKWITQKYGVHVAWASFVARYVAGTRTIVFVSAGSMHYSFPRFLVIIFLAACSQGYLFLLAADFISIHILPYLKNRFVQAFLAFLLIAAVMFLNHFFTKRTGSKIPSAAAPEKK